MSHSRGLRWGRWDFLPELSRQAGRARVRPHGKSWLQRLEAPKPHTGDHIVGTTYWGLGPSSAIILLHDFGESPFLFWLWLPHSIHLETSGPTHLWASSVLVKKGDKKNLWSKVVGTEAMLQGSRGREEIIGLKTQSWQDWVYYCPQCSLNGTAVQSRNP